MVLLSRVLLWNRCRFRELAKSLICCCINILTAKRTNPNRGLSEIVKAVVLPHRSIRLGPIF